MDGSFQRTAEALDAADLVFPILTDPPPPPRAGSLDQYYDHLLDLFESAMKAVAATLVREAKFDTTDFATAKGRGCEGFTLLVSRTRADSRDGWFGAFQRGDERLDVIGHLE